MNIELLSPAGEIKSAEAAFQYGADAIYLGLDKFSARSGLSNFTLEDLEKLIAIYGTTKKIYVAINTLIKDNELDDVINMLEELSVAGVTGVIVQDLGVASIVKKHFPNLELHASTQMAVHNKAGAQALKDYGFSRVVLARELSLDEIADISSIGIETEVFIHGALCFGYSGLCLASAMLTGKSANRGTCLYPCRDAYAVNGNNKNSSHVFSMKDMAQNQNVNDLVKAGVASLKIEGRKKNSLYVASVTDYYRKILDGETSKYKLENLNRNIRTIFSRGQTDLYMHNRKNSGVIETDIMGHRGAELSSKAKQVVYKGKTYAELITPMKLEVRDGIQVDVLGAEKPFGFSIEKLLCSDNSNNWKEVFKVGENSLVRILLPRNVPALESKVKIYCSSSADVKQNYQVISDNKEYVLSKYKLSMDCKLLKDKINITAREETTGQVFVFEEALSGLEKANNPQKVEEGVAKAFMQTGGSEFSLKEFVFTNNDNLFLPLSEAKNIRRKTLDAFAIDVKKYREERLARIKQELFVSSKTQPCSNKKIIKIDNVEYLNGFYSQELADIDEICLDLTSISYLDADELALNSDKHKIRLAMPIICRDHEYKSLSKNVKKLLDSGFNKWQITGAWGFEALGQKFGSKISSELDVSADWSFYGFNSIAIKEMADMGITRVCVAPEDDVENIKAIVEKSPIEVELIAYGDIPLFISDNCAYRAYNDGCPEDKSLCKANNKVELLSSHGNEMVLIRNKCRNLVISKKSRNIVAEYKKLASFGLSLRADFLYREYNPEEVNEIWTSL